ncbi:MAG: PorT family protein [Ferruginibacter sp.]|nr:PorT family protein [Cytophagales bacterium]
MRKNLFSPVRFAASASLLVLMFLTMAGTAVAQSEETDLKFGVKGGLNISQLYVDQPDAEDENVKLGIHAGLFLKAPLSDFFAIQPELLFSSQGAKVTYRGSGLLGIQSGEVRFNLNYIQLPILASITAGPLHFQAGPYISYLVSANVKDLKDDGTVAGSREVDESDFRTFDYGLAGGLGVDVQGFQLGARYNYGLQEIGDSDSFVGELTRNSKNSVIQLYIGLGF